MGRHRLGIVGYGGFGAFLHAAWNQMPEVQVAAVADADSRRRPQGVRFYTDWRRLIADPEVDVVSIATPPSSHEVIACEAMRAGKHVLIEKPIATTVESARRILAVRDQTGRVAAVNFMLRFNPIVEAIQDWSRSGAFGGLRRVVVENYAQDEALAPEHWFWDEAVSGGILVEHAVHFIDIVNGCTEALPVQVDGVSVRRNTRQEDRMLLTARYADGLVMTQYHAFSRPNFFEQTTMRFVFDLAQVEVEGWVPLSGTVRALVNAGTEQSLQELPGLKVASRVPVAAQIGSAERTAYAEGAAPVRSGGEDHFVTFDVGASFELPTPKPEAYAGALRAHMRDLVQAIEQPGHLLRVPLERGIESLAIAEEATRRARGRH